MYKCLAVLTAAAAARTPQIRVPEHLNSSALAALVRAATLNGVALDVTAPPRRSVRWTRYWAAASKAAAVWRAAPKTHKTKAREKPLKDACTSLIPNATVVALRAEAMSGVGC